MFSKKTTKIDQIFTVDLTFTKQIDGEIFFNFFGLLSKHELYLSPNLSKLAPADICSKL